MTRATSYQPVVTGAAEILPNDPHAPRREMHPSPLGHVLVWLLLAACFTMLVVNYSLNRGKLIVPAHYDDVSYLRDGLAKLNLFYKGGVDGLLYSVYLKPPHSPFATAVAFWGYAIFGTHDWSPYAANGIIILGLLAFADYLTRGVRPWQKLAVFLFVLSVPIAAQSIFEFRPDMAVGLMTAIFIVLLIQQPLLRSSRRYLLATGALLGITLLSKTSVFPITLAFAGSAVIAATVRDRIVLGREVNLRPIAKAWATIAIPAILIPLPFYIFNHHEIYHYIKDNALGKNQHIWTLHASRSTHLLYYFVGEGTQVMLGRHFYMMAIPAIAGLAVILAQRRRSEMCRAGCYLLMLFVTYLVPTTNPIKDPFLAVTYDFLWIFITLMLIRAALTTRWPSIQPIAAAGLVLLVLAGAYCDKWPLYWGEVTRPDAVRRNAYMNDLYHSILAHDPERTGEVLIAVSGEFVNADALGYMADKDGLTTIKFVSDFWKNDMGAFNKALDQSRFVIIGDQNNPEDDPHTPYTAMLDRTLPMVRSRSDMELIATCPAGDGKNYYLYQHRPGGA